MRLKKVHDLVYNSCAHHCESVSSHTVIQRGEEGGGVFALFLSDMLNP
jgi:hypothetical protein